MKTTKLAAGIVIMERFGPRLDGAERLLSIPTQLEDVHGTKYVEELESCQKVADEVKGRSCSETPVDTVDVRDDVKPLDDCDGFSKEKETAAKPSESVESGNSREDGEKLNEELIETLKHWMEPFDSMVSPLPTSPTGLQVDNPEADWRNDIPGNYVDTVSECDTNTESEDEGEVRDRKVRLAGRCEVLRSTSNKAGTVRRTGDRWKLTGGR